MNREGVCGAEAEEKGVLRLCTIVILGWGVKKGLEAGEDGTLCHKVAWVAVVIIEEGRDVHAEASVVRKDHSFLQPHRTQKHKRCAFGAGALFL